MKSITKSILLTIDEDVKEGLRKEADKLGMRLVTYIRMVLIKNLENSKEKGER